MLVHHKSLPTAMVLWIRRTPVYIFDSNVYLWRLTDALSSSSYAVTIIRHWDWVISVYQAPIRYQWRRMKRVEECGKNETTHLSCWKSFIFLLKISLHMHLVFHQRYEKCVIFFHFSMHYIETTHMFLFCSLSLATIVLVKLCSSSIVLYQCFANFLSHFHTNIDPFYSI